MTQPSLPDRALAMARAKKIAEDYTHPETGCGRDTKSYKLARALLAANEENAAIRMVLVEAFRALDKALHDNPNWLGYVERARDACRAALRPGDPHEDR